MTLRSGEAIAADFVVLAVPFDRVARRSSPDDLAGGSPALDGLDALDGLADHGVHLWFDRPVCPFDHVVTVGRLIQWVFNHTAIQGRRPGDAAAGSTSNSSSAPSYDLLPLDKTAIRDAVLAELAEIWPAAREATLLRWWVVTEHGATFAVRPGVDALRPPQRTPVDGLFLAGDWTATGWPATMEGAVRSGYLAAEGILEDLGRPATSAPARPARRAASPAARWLARPETARPGQALDGRGLRSRSRRPSDRPAPAVSRRPAPPAPRLLGADAGQGVEGGGVGRDHDQAAQDDHHRRRDRQARRPPEGAEEDRAEEDRHRVEPHDPAVKLRLDQVALDQVERQEHRDHRQRLPPAPQAQRDDRRARRPRSAGRNRAPPP